MTSFLKGFLSLIIAINWSEYISLKKDLINIDVAVRYCKDIQKIIMNNKKLCPWALVAT